MFKEYPFLKSYYRAVVEDVRTLLEKRNDASVYIPIPYPTP